MDPREPLPGAGGDAAVRRGPAPGRARRRSASRGPTPPRPCRSRRAGRWRSSTRRWPGRARPPRPSPPPSSASRRTARWRGVPSASSSGPDAGILEIGQGEWEGVTHDDIARRWPAELSAWRRRPHEAWAPGGESLAQVAGRAPGPRSRAILERLGPRLPARHPRPPAGRRLRGRRAGGRPAVVDPRRPRRRVQGRAADAVRPAARRTSGCSRFGLSGITVVEFRGGRPVLRAHNLTEHLAPLARRAGAQEAAERRARSGAL